MELVTNLLAIAFVAQLPQICHTFAVLRVNKVKKVNKVSLFILDNPINFTKKVYSTFQRAVSLYIEMKDLLKKSLRFKAFSA